MGIWRISRVSQVAVGACRRRTRSQTTRPPAASTATPTPRRTRGSVELPPLSESGRAAPPVLVGDAVAVGGVVVGAAPDVSGGTLAVREPTRFSTPYPYSGSRPGAPLSVAVAVSRWMTSLADRFGYLDRTRAAAPATIAVESLVPSATRYPPTPSVDTIRIPGAERSIALPVTVRAALLPSWSVAPTATTPGNAAGKAASCIFGLLPMPAMTTISAAKADSIASRISGTSDPPCEIEMILAPDFV